MAGKIAGQLFCEVVDVNYTNQNGHISLFFIFLDWNGIGTG